MYSNCPQQQTSRTLNRTLNHHSHYTAMAKRRRSITMTRTGQDNQLWSYSEFLSSLALTIECICC